MPLTKEDFTTAFLILEIMRDQSKQLTPDEKKVVNEAHSIMQEYEKHYSNKY